MFEIQYDLTFTYSKRLALMIDMKIELINDFDQNPSDYGCDKTSQWDWRE